VLILGVDPGSVVTGYGIVLEAGGALRRAGSGIIEMKSSESLSARLETVYRGLVNVIDEFQPSAFCIETAFYGKNIQSTLKLGQVRGVSILAAAHKGLTAAEYSPREIKQAVTGRGGATKAQTAFMVKKILDIEVDFRRTDEADALAAAICHAWRHTATRNKRGNSWSDFITANPERVRA